MVFIIGGCMKINDIGDGNVVVDHSSTGDSVELFFNGDNNRVVIESACNLRNLNINIVGNNNEIIIGRRCSLRGSLNARHGSKINIGKCTSFVDARLFALEGTILVVGEYCMFSSRVYIRTSDEHPIYDLTTKNRINLAKNIYIHDKVWIGDNVTINKGVDVAEGVIIGACSVVLKSLKEANSIYAGAPARFIRSNVLWERHFSDDSQ